MTALDLFGTVADLIDAALRWLVTQGAVHVANAENGVLVRMLPLLILPFASARAFRKQAWLLGLALGAIELYFAYNRLTVFADKPLALAELMGNVGEALLGLLLLLPQAFWRKSLEAHHDD